MAFVSPVLVPSTARNRCFSGGARAGRQSGRFEASGGRQQPDAEQDRRHARAVTMTRWWGAWFGPRPERREAAGPAVRPLPRLIGSPRHRDAGRGMRTSRVLPLIRQRPGTAGARRERPGAPPRRVAAAGFEHPGLDPRSDRGHGLPDEWTQRLGPAQGKHRHRQRGPPPPFVLRDGVGDRPVRPEARPQRVRIIGQRRDVDQIDSRPRTWASLTPSSRVTAVGWSAGTRRPWLMSRNRRRPRPLLSERRRP